MFQRVAGKLFLLQNQKIRKKCGKTNIRQKLIRQVKIFKILSFLTFIIILVLQGCLSCTVA